MSMVGLEMILGPFETMTATAMRTSPIKRLNDQYNSTCVIHFVCRPLQNNDVKWPNFRSLENVNHDDKYFMFHV